MQTEIGEVRPKPRHFKTRASHVEAAFSLLQQGKSRQEIAAETGLTGDTLTYAIRDNYQRGYVERPDTQTQRRAHRENTSAGKGGILLAVRNYFPLDLTSRQTQVALQVDHGIMIEDHKRITNAYSRERHRHGLQRPITELTVEAQRDKRRSPDDLLCIVRRRQAAHDLMTATGLGKPKTLREWYLLEEDVVNMRNQVLEVLDDQNLIPDDFVAQRYILTLYEARKLWVDTGDRSLIDNFPPEFEQIDSNIVDRLKDQRQIVIKKTPHNGNGNIHRTTIAEPSEVKQGETGWR